MSTTWSRLSCCIKAENRKKYRLLFFAALGCTSLSCHDGKEHGTKAPDAHQVKREPARDKRLVPYVIVDRRKRWSTEVEALSAPVLQEQPGYIQVVVSLGLPQRLNCFVYEQPLLTGQALYRLLTAVSPGLRFTAMSPLQFEFTSGKPLILLSVDHESTLPPIETGRLLVVMSPRPAYPVVCTYDALEGDSTARRAALHMIDQLKSDADEPEGLIMSEIWKTETNALVDGFSRMSFTLENDELTVISEESRCEVKGVALKCADSLSVEVADSAGLRLGTWIEIEQGETRLRAQAERQGDLSVYRYGFERGVERATGTFQTKMRLASKARFFFALLSDEGDKKSSYLYYAPGLSPNAPVESRLRRSNERTRCITKVTAAGISVHSHVELADDSFPARIQFVSNCDGESDFGRTYLNAKMRASLLMRHWLRPAVGLKDWFEASSLAVEDPSSSPKAAEEAEHGTAK